MGPGAFDSLGAQPGSLRSKRYLVVRDVPERLDPSAFPASGLDLAPAAGAVVGDYLPEHRCEGGFVDRLALANGDHARRLVVVARGDDALGVGDDPPL